MKQREAFLTSMKEALIAKRDELISLLGKINQGNKAASQIKDLADEASSTVMDRLQSSLQETEVREIKLIEEALVRIDKGEYGICLDCGEEISPKRLEYSPYAARCITCQELLEG